MQIGIAPVRLDMATRPQLATHGPVGAPQVQSAAQVSPRVCEGPVQSAVTRCVVPGSHTPGDCVVIHGSQWHVASHKRCCSPHIVNV
jgi:hypothetical protein